MSAGTLRAIIISLTALSVALSFFLGGAQQIGLDPTLALVIGAVLAAINAVLGLLPSATGRSGLEPGKTEKEVARGAYVAGQKQDSVPRAIV